jgi:hypothetical protein
VVCDGTCVDTSTSDAYCGNCTTACSGEPKCQDGACTKCSGSLTACGNSCVDTKTSKQHCGDCSTVCSATQTCVGGTCTTDVTTEPCTPNYTVGNSESVTTPNFGTSDAYCIKVNMSCVGGWHCNNTTGRTVQVNDAARICDQMPMPAKVNGAYYFEFTGGASAVPYASLTLWKGGCSP